MYQHAPLSVFIPPEKLIKLAQGYLRDGSLEGTALFLGTIPISGSGFGFAPTFSGELVDEARQRKLSFNYRIKVIDWLKEDF